MRFFEFSILTVMTGAITYFLLDRLPVRAFEPDMTPQAWVSFGFICLTLFLFICTLASCFF